jgi:membrane-associated phospholipid phosphatase
MIISFTSKAFFAHDRPILYFEKLGNLDTINLVEGVYEVTGQTSFPSGHTMSGFALFGILAFLVGKKNIVGTICFITALLVGISRIYLVQHFLKDVYLGAIMGSTIALCIYWFQSRYSINENKLIDRRINYKKRV